MLRLRLGGGASVGFRVTVSLMAALAWAVVSCGRGDAHEDARAEIEITAVDTLQVATIRISAAELTSLPVWDAVRDQAVQISDRTSPSSQSLGPIWDSRQLPDGSIVVIAGERQAVLHVFDTSGSARRPPALLTTPRPAIPPARLAGSGDTSFVLASHYVFRIDPDGRVTRTVIAADDLAGAAGIEAVGRFADGSIAAQWFGTARITREQRTSPMVFARTRGLSASDPARHETTVLFVTPLISDPVLGAVPWRGRPRAAVDAQSIWVAHADHAEVIRVDMNGDILARVTWDPGDRTLSPEDFAIWQGGEIERIGRANAAEHLKEDAIHRLEELQPGGTIPAIQDVQFGSDGRLWVRPRRMPGDTNLVTGWLCFTPAGEPLGRVFLPREAVAHEFGDSSVLVQVSDAGGPMVVRYRFATAADAR